MLLAGTTAVVHATHLTDEDVALLGGAGTGACFCPTTERDLADGIGPARALADAGCPPAPSAATSTPSSTSSRRSAGSRCTSGWSASSAAASRRPTCSRWRTVDGYRSLGWPDGGRLAAGTRADLVAVRTDSPRTAGCAHDQVLYAATSADVTDVVVAGEHVVSDGQHRLGDVGRLLAGVHLGGAAMSAPMSEPGSVLVTGIGELVTCAGPDGATPVADRSLSAEQRLGVVRDAVVVVEDGVVAWVGPAAQAPAADRVLDLGGRAVVPGFVDSHTHLVFAGDRSAEFAARMAGTPYDGGGIGVSVAATRAASDDELRGPARRPGRRGPGARAPRRSRSRAATG